MRENSAEKSPKTKQRIIHPFEPFYDENSTVLIVGSFPSVASRADGFYYGNPHNRFWKVLATVFSERAPLQISEKKDFLLCHKIAIYDAIKECKITGSSDSSIRDVVPADIKSIVEKSKVRKIFANGKTAEKFFMKYQCPELCLLLKELPSTSPANASFSLERLVEEWKVIADD